MGTPNLSIEQVEMVRRLRNSGASLLQIKEAYQVFDRVDHEFGSFGNVKVSQPVHETTVVTANQSRTHPHFNISQNNLNSAILEQHKTVRTGNTPSQLPNYNYNPSQTPVHIKSLIHSHSKVSQSRDVLPNQSSPFQFVLNEVASNAKLVLSRKGDERTVKVNGATPVAANNDNSGGSTITNNQHVGNHSQQTTVSCPANYVDHNFRNSMGETSQTETASSSFCHMKQDISSNINKTDGTGISFGTNVTESALREAGRCMLLSADRDQILSLLRKCSLTIPSFQPSQLCSLHGLSEAELDSFLSGHIPQERDSGLQIVDWFINFLIETEWFISDILEYSQQLMIPKHLDNDEHDLDLTPRRERFTFREKHLEVLEVHFKTDRYPSQNKRKLIANECNIKMAMTTSNDLEEKERVTHVNVNHWFRNKRKELIRKAKLDRINGHPGLLDRDILSASGRLVPANPMVNSLPPESYPTTQDYRPINFQQHSLPSNDILEVNTTVSPEPANTESRPASTISTLNFDPSHSLEKQPSVDSDNASQQTFIKFTPVEIKTEPNDEEDVMAFP